MNQSSHEKFFSIDSKEVFTGFKISDIKTFSGAYPYVITFAEFDVFGFEEKCSYKVAKSYRNTPFILICIMINCK